MISESVSTETTADCLKLVQDYLPEEFMLLTVEDVNVSIQTGGLVNTLKLITRKSDNYKLLIRQYGGNAFDIDRFRELRSPTSWQLLIFHELSKMKIGPKLLGVFDDGRIEEFIPSHTLKPEEFNDEEILKDLAINTAIIHSLKLPFSQSATFMQELMKKWHETFMKSFDPVAFLNKYKNGIISCGADFEKYVEILKTNWMEEGMKLRSISEKFDQRNGLILWDNNSLNVLIRDDPKPGQLKTCIIDYECCRYDNVVRDIAARFVNRLVDFGGKGKDKATGFKIPEEKIRRLFIREYLKEYKKQQMAQVSELDQKVISGQEASIDEKEVDQWLFECDHFIPQNMISFIAMTFMADVFLEKDITFVFVALTCYREFQEWKSYLKTKYGTLD